MDHHSILASAFAAVERLDLSHRDDGRRQPGLVDAHERSVAFLAEHGLVPDSRVRRYLDRAAVVEGLAIALPDLCPARFQLVLDWTHHNCLHDDAMERLGDLYTVAEVSRAYADALAGRPVARPAHPLVASMVAWRARAVEVGVASDLLAHFAERAARMATQFLLEHLHARHEIRLGEAEYLRQRVDSGPSDAWYALLDLVWGPEGRPTPENVATLRRLATAANVAGNELRTLGRELDQGNGSNLLVQAPDPAAAVERLLEFHNQQTRALEVAAHAPDPATRAYARRLARAVYATHVYERSSHRGLAWTPTAQMA